MDSIGETVGKFIWRVWNLPDVKCGLKEHCESCQKPFRCTVSLATTPAYHLHKGWRSEAVTGHLSGYCWANARGGVHNL